MRYLHASMKTMLVPIGYSLELCRTERGWQPGRWLWFCEMKWSKQLYQILKHSLNGGSWDVTSCLQRRQQLLSGRLFLNRVILISLTFHAFIPSEHLQVLSVPQGNWVPFILQLSLEAMTIVNRLRCFLLFLIFLGLNSFYPF